jgi:putative PIN family toxin of toxin-antitoxin system
MRVVFDSNIFVSALVFPGSRADAALQRILDGTDILLVSPAIIDEVLRVLAEKFSRDREELSRVALLLSDLAETVRPVNRLALLADEPDNRILECAIAGKAVAVVTGDKAMLSLGETHGIAIMSLRDYLTGT